MSNRYKKMTNRQKKFSKYFNGNIEETVKTMKENNISISVTDCIKYLRNSLAVRTSLRRRFKDSTEVIKLIDDYGTQSLKYGRLKNISDIKEPLPNKQTKPKIMTREEILIKLTVLGRNGENATIRIKAMELCARIQGFMTNQIEYSGSSDKPVIFSHSFNLPEKFEHLLQSVINSGFMKRLVNLFMYTEKHNH